MITNTSESLRHSEVIKSGLLIAQGLKEKSQNYKKLLTEVLKWTGGQPLLTQKLCQLIVELRIHLR
jgi:molybdenum cofactor biosynthesis enzyme MoaA